MTTPLWFPDVCVNVSVQVYTGEERAIKRALFAFFSFFLWKEHARMGITKMQVRS